MEKELAGKESTAGKAGTSGSARGRVSRWGWSAHWDGVGTIGDRRIHACPSGPRIVPARRKPQAPPPLQPPPPPLQPPPRTPSDDLPWGDLTLNKCLVLASLVALLGSALRLCRGELHKTGSPQGLGAFPVALPRLRLFCSYKPYPQASLPLFLE